MSGKTSADNAERRDGAQQPRELLDKTLNELLGQARKVLSRRQRSELKQAYQNGDYGKAVKILEGEFRRRLELAMRSQRTETAPQETANSGRTAREEENANMATVNASAAASGNPPWLVILAVLALAILVLAALKKAGKSSPPNPNAKVGEIMRQSETYVKATDGERDFLELIRLLALASDKTDEYLKD